VGVSTTQGGVPALANHERFEDGEEVDAMCGQGIAAEEAGALGGAGACSGSARARRTTTAPQHDPRTGWGLFSSRTSRTGDWRKKEDTKDEDDEKLGAPTTRHRRGATLLGVGVRAVKGGGCSLPGDDDDDDRRSRSCVDARSSEEPPKARVGGQKRGRSSR